MCIRDRDVIAGQAGQEVELKYVLDLREFPDSPVADKIVHDFKVIQPIGDLFHGCRFYFYHFKIKRKIATGNITMWGNCKN